MSETSYILEANGDNFDRLVLENSRKGLVLVDFWAPWAGPSLRQREMLMELAQSLQGRFLLVSVNIDEQKPLAERYQVKSLPVFKLFRNGQVVEEVRGVQPRADYQAIVDRHLTAMTDPVCTAAALAWNAGDTDKALQTLAEGAMEEPDNLRIPDMMAKLLIRLERFEDAGAVLNALPTEAQDSSEIAGLLAHLDFILAGRSAPPLVDIEKALEQDAGDAVSRFQLAALALLNDDHETALLSLMEILRRDRLWQGGKARRGLLAIFEVLGGEHALVKKYRNELSRLIY